MILDLIQLYLNVISEDFDDQYECENNFFRFFFNFLTDGSLNIFIK